MGLKEVKYRWSPTLGELEDTPEKIWGIEEFDPLIDDPETPVVFAGLYGLPDFYALWKHKGKKYVWWTGSDIRHFMKGYWLEDGGGIKLDPKALAEWINKYCESWVENDVERRALKCYGIESQVSPSFMGDVNNFEVSFKPGNKLYTSVSGDDFEVYGWRLIPLLAEQNPGIEFHLYGNRGEWKSNHKNVVVHGRVPKEQMNAEIKDMQGALRLTEFDGFSEILAKSVLMGQYPVSLIHYPQILDLSDISQILDKAAPNLAAREYYLQIINKYPWIRN